MTDIGPRDWVVALVNRASRHGNLRLTKDALYQVRDVIPTYGPCFNCGASDDGSGILLMGQARVPDARVHECSWCPCHFRKWPSPADAALMEEEAPLDAVPVVVPA